MEQNFKTVEVDGMTFDIQYYPATKALKIFTALTKLAGAPMAQGLAAIEGVSNVEEMKVDGLSKVIEALMNNIDESKVEMLIKDIFSTTMHEGQDLHKNFNTVFMGKTASIFKLVYEVLAFQYGDMGKFISELMKKGIAQLPKKPKIMNGQNI